MPEIPAKSATLAQLKQFCDENGLDYAEIEASNPLAMRTKLLALVNRSGLVDGENIYIETEEPALEFTGATPPPAPAPKARGAEQLRPAVFAAIASALWPDTKSGHALPAGMTPAQAMAAAVAHRDKTRADPRNPFPGKAHGDTVKMLISKQDGRTVAGGDQPVFVNVNDRAAGVQRGEWVDLPWEYAQVIANSKISLTETDEAHGMRIVGEVHSFPFHAQS